MSENKFTPGPWVVTKYGYEKYSVNGKNMVEICSCWSVNNAKLIAAAPELLEALEPFAQFACSPPGECECNNCHARDVIAKTKGLP